MSQSLKQAPKPRCVWHGGDLRPRGSFSYNTQNECYTDSINTVEVKPSDLTDAKIHLYTHVWKWGVMQIQSKEPLSSTCLARLQSLLNQAVLWIGFA